MQGTILKIKADGTIHPSSVNGPPKLELLKEAIGGGWLEAVPYFNKIVYDGKLVTCIVFCDEEGKLKEFPLNTLATNLWYVSMGQSVPDVLVGDIAIVFGDKEFMLAL